MTSRDILEARLVLYRLLAALYRYPLTAEKLSALQGLQAEGESSAAQAVCALQQAVGNPSVERLSVEMTRLMEGPGVTPAVPYASYYLNGKQLMGAAAQTVHRLYLEHGVEPEQGSIPPDHIALELGFLSVLAERALTDADLAPVLEASLRFLREHLQPWLGMFCAALETSSREPFFAALAQATQQFVDEDAAWLQEALRETAASLS